MWIVVAVLVVVIVVPAVVALMWLGITEVVTEPEHENVVLNFESPVVTRRQIADESYWEASFQIHMLTPRDETVDWSDVRIVIKSNDGRVLNTLTRPLPDDPDAYDDGTDGSVDIQFWYDTSIPDSMVLGAGDTIRVTGMTVAYEGGTFEVWYQGRQIGDSLFPTDFP